VKLLLDEMISFRIAADLRSRGHDVAAVKRDRPELQSVPDLTLVQLMAIESRAIVTNNVKDYQPIHQAMLAAGRDHAGMVFTFDATMPRTKAQIPLWVARLEAALHDHPSPTALVNRVLHLP
jgi:predicted nuclease of predicted toxin-antitoxin system